MPEAERRRAPLIGLSILVGAAWSFAVGVQAADGTGATLYAQHCEVCHQPDGNGIRGIIPPLAGNVRVTGDDRAQVQDFLRRIIFGYHGGLIVNGQVYSGRMPPIGRVGRVNDTELRDLVNYVRMSWGSRARPVTFEEIAQARASTAPATD